MSRQLRMEAGLARFAELDMARAARFAGTLGLEAEFLDPLYRVWVETDPDAALAELKLLRPRSLQRLLAISVLEVVGNDAGASSRPPLPCQHRIA